MNFVLLLIAAMPYLATWLLLETLPSRADAQTPPQEGINQNFLKESGLASCVANEHDVKK